MFGLISYNAYGQGYYKPDPDDAPRNWLSPGIFFLGGQTPFFSPYPESAVLSYHYQLDAHLFSLRGLWTGTLCFTCDDTDEFWDLSLLYGRSTISEYYHASVSAGLGVIDGDRADTPDEERDAPTTIGLAVQVQTFIHISQNFGLGLYGYANFNSVEQLYGITLNLQLGKLRD